MYKRQQGLLPLLFHFGGLIFLSLSIINLIVWIPRALFHQNVPANFDPIVVLLTDFPVLVIAALLLLNVFPEIRLTPEGLKYHVWPLPIFGLIRWSEVESVVQVRFEFIRIAINRDGVSFFNGLLFQRIIGWYMRHEFPLIFLSPGLQSREEIVQEILRHSNVKKVRLASDVYS